MMRESKERIFSTLRWIATGIALLYLIVFLANFFWRHGSNELSLQVEWGIPDNPKFVITLALVCGASAAWLFRDTGKLVSTLLSISLIAYEMWVWFDLTRDIKTNTGLTRLPRTNLIGNWLIGGGVIDIVGLLGAVVLLVFSLGRFLTSYNVAIQQNHHLDALSRR